MGLGFRQFFVAGSWSDLRSRLVSAVVLGLFVLALTVIGGWPFRLLCFATGLIVFDEWSRISRARRAGPIFSFARRALIVALLVFVFGFYFLALGVVVLAAAFIAFVDRNERKADWVLGGLLYSALAALAPGMLRGDDNAGLAALGFVIAVVWSTDIFAYFTGRSFGGPKLLPMVSPKKTISGAVGGLVAGIICGALFVLWIGDPVSPFLLVLAAVLSALGQAGDLYESWIKRRFGVKDSGRLIPGHGGLMDRIDALIVALGAAWLVGLIVAGFGNPAHGIFAF
ncbi:phosphatidate cytidylyltransferase [Aurantimonas marianensis]|uniref:Phosphatidate cytidylyltransferase n=1 Tax=Aurantimonas marianensis TaxID=2920428 RepID=A0A9X2H2T6_9HYPH|nr:phosphatidate cytidylyltransferase [Aurantimonas marianensis]MCP3054600.1 phosphatidate cytidylyltransferase [Aurantimonas marianensis]